jgi:hypothetical protein
MLRVYNLVAFVCVCVENKFFIKKGTVPTLLIWNSVSFSSDRMKE